MPFVLNTLSTPVARLASSGLIVRVSSAADYLV
jgi:hypothetical protein